MLAATAAACAVWGLVTVAARAGLPYQLDYEEGNILNAAVRILHGLSPYPNPHILPNVINPYGPVIYFVDAALVKVFGLTFFPGRMMVIVSGVVIAIFIAVLLRRETNSLAVGVAFGALFLCSPFVQFWWPLLRVDLPGLALTLAGLIVFHRNPRRAWIAGVLFVLAIFTKHTLVAAPAACVVWSLMNHQKKEAARLLAVCIVLGGLALAAGEIATHGVLAFALFRTHPDPYVWSAYPAALRQVAEDNVVLVAFAAVLLAGNLWQKRISLPLLYLIFATLTTMTIGKAGSNSNHLIEPMAALCIAGGAGWKYLLELEGVRQFVPLALALLAAGQAVDGSRTLAFEPRNSACEQVIELVRQQLGSAVLSENTGAVVLAGKTPLISNPFVYTQLVKYAGWNDYDLVNMLRLRRVPLVLIDAGRRQQWSKAVMQSLHENYRLFSRPGCRGASLAFVPER